MTSYTGSEVALVLQRVQFAIYAFANTTRYAKTLVKIDHESRMAHPDFMPYCFYKDVGIIYFSGLCTFFWEKRDTDVLNKFKTSDDQRKTLIKNLRNVNAHISYFDETISAGQEFSAGLKSVMVIEDLVMLLNHLSKIIEQQLPEFIPQLNNSLLNMKKLFPEMEAD